MRTIRWSLLLGCVLVLAGQAVAQAKPEVKKAPTARIEPVLGRIPAGSAGFVVVNNLKGSIDRAEEFLKTIGLGEMIKQQMPAGLLKTALAGLKVGEGFNASGGLAAVMLDPAKFDIDLIKMIAGGGRPTTAPKKSPKLPLVVFVPGKGVEGVFAQYKPVRAGKSWKVAAPMGPVFARQHGGYILLSPTDKAIDAVVASVKPVARDLTAAQNAILARSDIGLYLNMEVVGPLGAKGLDLFEAKFKKVRSPAMPMDMGKVIAFYKALLTQVRGAVVTVRLGGTAVILDKVVTFKPDSGIGKALAAAKFVRGLPLGRLPNLPYVLAASTHYPGKEANKQWMDLMSPLWAAMFKGDKAGAAKFEKLVSDFADQVVTEQFVLGGAPEGSGLFGLAYVVTCKDSAKVKSLTADAAATWKTMLTSMVPEGGPRDEIAKIEIIYSKGVETVGGLSVDTIKVNHPQIAEMDEDERAAMTKILGEDKIRIFLAAPDKTTVVMTFGGGKAFLAEALKAAKGRGTIPAAKGVKTVMKALPKNPQMVLLFSAGNLWDVVKKALTVMEGPVPPVNITTRTPIAVGAKVGRASIHAAVYVPTALVKELVQIGLTFRAFTGRQPPAGRVEPLEVMPEGAAEDF